MAYIIPYFKCNKYSDLSVQSLPVPWSRSSPGAVKLNETVRFWKEVAVTVKSVIFIGAKISSPGFQFSGVELTRLEPPPTVLENSGAAS